MSYNQLLKGRSSQSFSIYHITICTKDRKPYFTDFTLARILVNEMKKLDDDKVLESLSFVVMPDHFHWLFQLGDTSSLATVFHQLKGLTARKINQHIKQHDVVN